MQRFGGSHRNFKSPRKKGFFSRTKKTEQYLGRRRIRHSAEPLVLKSRFTGYGAQAKMSKFWKRISQCLLPALILTWLGLLIYLPYFKITKVVYYGLQILKKEEINNYLTSTVFKNQLPFLPSNNYFFLSSSKIESTIEKKFALSSVVVTKVFPNELHIELKEKISSMIYENNKQYFLLDQSGSIIKFLGEETAAGFSTSTANDPLINHYSLGVPAEASSTTLPSLGFDTASTTPPAPSFVPPPNYLKIRTLFGDLPLLLDSSFVSSTDNETSIVRTGTIKGALSFEEMLEKRGVATVKYFELQDPGAGLAVHTTQRWIIYFQPAQDLENQFANLKLILQSNHPSEYIDLRYGERVYWK